MTEIDVRQRELLRLLWREGRLSRWELHERTGVNPNAVGLDVGGLLTQRIVRECQSEPVGPGRPRVPLEIDPVGRHVVGIAISPGHVEVATLNLRGQLNSDVRMENIPEVEQLVLRAAQMLKETVNSETLVVGLSVTGTHGSENHELVQGSLTGGTRTISLAPLVKAAGNCPLVLENNVHALAARWLLTHRSESKDDVLLVQFDDGHLSASWLVEGRPSHGSAISTNELGHNRFFIDTEMCYCGQTGCLERICSTAFLRRLGEKEKTLAQCIAEYDGTQKPLTTIIDYMATGCANAVNFTGPHRLVLISELMQHETFARSLTEKIHVRILGGLNERLTIDQWNKSAALSAETAGWLALANLYRADWTRKSRREPQPA